MEQIPPETTSRILNGVAFLNEYFGVALNAMLTLNFAQLGVFTQPAAAKAFTSLNEGVAGFLTSKGRYFGIELRHHYIYAHERCERFGWHVHELIVMPLALRHDFRAWLKEWQTRHYPLAHPNALNYRQGHAKRYVENQAFVQSRMVRYVLKSTGHATVLDRDGEIAILGELLSVGGHRSLPLHLPRIAGTSQSIAQAAQRAAGFEPPLDWEDLLPSRQLDRFLQRKHSEELSAQLRAIWGAEDASMGMAVS